jgi:hypothetical protein
MPISTGFPDASVQLVPPEAVVLTVPWHRTETTWLPVPGMICQLLVNEIRVGAQVPQFTVRGVPQLSDALSEPQVLPRRAQNPESLSGVHTQAPWLQLWPVGQGVVVVEYVHVPALHVPGVTGVTRSPPAEHVAAGGWLQTTPAQGSPLHWPAEQPEEHGASEDVYLHWPVAPSHIPGDAQVRRLEPTHEGPGGWLQCTLAQRSCVQ